MTIQRKTGRAGAACGALLAALLLAAVPATRADDGITAFSTAALGEPPAAWSFVTLPRKTPTRFTVVELGGAHVLKVESDDSYGNLVHPVHVQPNGHNTLAWRWRVDRLVEGADLKTRSGDDAAAKVCVFFAFESSKLSFGERAKLALVHTPGGMEVPTETLCYVWDNKLAPGTALVNAFTARIRFIVVESGSAKLAQWVDEKRDLIADYQRLFGDESAGQVPLISGIAVSADADNTNGHGLAYLGDITLTR